MFWDFDGVIKDSVDVKTRAYVRLFEPFGSEVAARVMEHHQRNGGMSRFEKIPMYLGWAGKSASSKEIDQFCDAFAIDVRQAVIDSAWIAGAREYLEANHVRQRFCLITATPQNEIEQILCELQIRHCFREVHGAPTAKSQAIGSVLARWRCDCRGALVIGDSETDYHAAVTNGVEFLLRRSTLNTDLQRRYGGPQCADFTDE